jgi:hypothetical protein
MFCFIATIMLIGVIIANEPISIQKVVVRYFSAILLGFLFWRFLLIGKHIWDKVDKSSKKLEIDQHISGVIWFKTWLYFTGFIGCVVLGLGIGTLVYIFFGFVCQLSFDIFQLAIDIYKRSLIFGFYVGNIAIIMLAYKRWRRKISGLGN